ncbi:MAG: immunoglobulin domain-containing protein [Clostridiales bacterium]|nr:immunoglobulin domain-containing protein [Clostridiales bacterium]
MFIWMGEYEMQKKTVLVFLSVLIALVICVSTAFAENGAIRTYLTFRITTQTQSAIVDVGEDLQIEVGVDGVEPTGYQWYFEGKAIEINGNERIYNLLNAQPEDAGVYTMEAYEGDEVVLKVEVNVRVINPVVIPASGDNSLPVEVVFGAALAAIGLMACLIVKRKARAEA